MLARPFVEPSPVVTVTLPAIVAVGACGSAPGCRANPGIAQIDRARSNAPSNGNDMNLAELRYLLTSTLLDRIALHRRGERVQLCRCPDRTPPRHAGRLARARSLLSLTAWIPR